VHRRLPASLGACSFSYRFGARSTSLGQVAGNARAKIDEAHLVRKRHDTRPEAGHDFTSAQDRQGDGHGKVSRPVSEGQGHDRELALNA
jgi:hypothetical protein